jgi:hypothetical protein
MTTTTKSTTQRWSVYCGHHDMGSHPVTLVKKTKQDAERTAKLMAECGYEGIEVKQITR